MSWPPYLFMWNTRNMLQQTDFYYTTQKAKWDYIYSTKEAILIKF